MTSPIAELDSSPSLRRVVLAGIHSVPITACPITAELGINIVNGDTLAGARSARRCAASSTPSATRSARGHTDHLPDRPRPARAAAGRPRCWRVTAIERPAELAEGSLGLMRIREMITAIVGTRRAPGDTNLHLIDGLELFGSAEAIDLPDGLHPNAAGYVRMGERFHQAAFMKGGPFSGGTM